MKIEIIPDECGGFEVYGKQYQVHPAADVVMRFVDPEYDYLSYVDREAQGITMHWLGSAALNTIVGWGIPETRQRFKMSQSEYDCYLEWQSNLGMQQFEEEVADIDFE